ncbi:hypothetical protein WA026_020532 [Henosepilachna vigintioctopunctata]|uniref:Uncharacterized protein n=1 Tax=Henosepilachna vigintioctopunctata TaxID=420089 RepID=A0AAW1VAZ6_9CUCU
MFDINTLKIDIRNGMTFICKPLHFSKEMGYVYDCNSSPGSPSSNSHFLGFSFKRPSPDRPTPHLSSLRRPSSILLNLQNDHEEWLLKCERFD